VFAAIDLCIIFSENRETPRLLPSRTIFDDLALLASAFRGNARILRNLFKPVPPNRCFVCLPHLPHPRIILAVRKSLTRDSCARARLEQRDREIAIPISETRFRRCIRSSIAMKLSSHRFSGSSLPAVSSFERLSLSFIIIVLYCAHHGPLC